MVLQLLSLDPSLSPLLPVLPRQNVLVPVILMTLIRFVQALNCLGFQLLVLSTGTDDDFLALLDLNVQALVSERLLHYFGLGRLIATYRLLGPPLLAPLHPSSN